jgi:hypothetical protein
VPLPLTTPHGATALVMKALSAFAWLMSARPIELVDGLAHQLCVASTGTSHGAVIAPTATNAGMMLVPLMSVREIAPHTLELPQA